MDSNNNTNKKINKFSIWSILLYVVTVSYTHLTLPTICSV